MTVQLSCLFILAGLTRIHSITTVSQVSVKAGESITIPCLYDSQYKNHVKYLCKGGSWSSCSTEVRTNSQHSSKFSISDDKSQRIFTVTMKYLTNEDTGYYWCAVDINGASDDGVYFYLSVTEGKPSVYVAHQEIKEFKLEYITIGCRYINSGESKWCRLGSSCVTDQSGSIDGTRVTINTRVRDVFSVTMSELRTESSGWYFCDSGGFQMPVCVTVTERPTTNFQMPVIVTVTGQSTTSTRHLPILSHTAEHVNHTTAQDGNLSPSNLLKSFSIRLSLLSFVTVTLFIWFMFTRHS